MEVPDPVVKVENDRLYVRREGGRWRLFWPRNKAERRAGRRISEGEEWTPSPSSPRSAE